MPTSPCRSTAGVATRRQRSSLVTFFSFSGKGAGIQSDRSAAAGKVRKSSAKADQDFALPAGAVYDHTHLIVSNSGATGGWRRRESNGRFVAGRPLDLQKRDFVAGIGSVRSKLAEDCKGLNFRIAIRSKSSGCFSSAPRTKNKNRNKNKNSSVPSRIFR